MKVFTRPSPQPWKLEVPKQLDLEEEFNPSDDITMEFLITEPDDYMDDNEPTSQYCLTAADLVAE